MAARQTSMEDAQPLRVRSLQARLHGQAICVRVRSLQVRLHGQAICARARSLQARLHGQVPFRAQLASAHKFLMGEVNTHHHLQAMAEEPAETVAELLQQDDGQDYDLDEAPSHQPQGHSGRQPRARQPARQPAPYHQHREGLSNLKVY